MQHKDRRDEHGSANCRPRFDMTASSIELDSVGGSRTLRASGVYRRGYESSSLTNTVRSRQVFHHTHFVGSAARASAHTFLPGTVVVAFLLCTSKWGSYIGLPPFFLTDLLVASAFLAAAFARPCRLAAVNFGSSMFAVLAAWTIIRFAAGANTSLVALRDVTPYMYSVLGFLAALAIPFSTSDQRTRSARLLWLALQAHLVWMTIVSVFPRLTDALPVLSNGVHFLEPREDMDGAILAITVFVAFEIATRTHRRYAYLVALVAFGLLLTVPSRAALLSLVVLAPMFVLIVRQRFDWRHKLDTILVSLTVLPAIVLIVLPSSAIGNRLLATFDPSRQTAEGYASAQGTWEARLKAWSSIVSYQRNESWTALFGSGFGSDFMTESGAARQLLGPLAAQSGVRSPHNYFIGTYARLGITGVLLVLVIVVATIGAIYLQRRFIAGEPLFLVASAVVLALIPVAAVGVILESPFGAIPFFWSAGAILGLPLANSMTSIDRREQKLIHIIGLGS